MTWNQLAAHLDKRGWNMPHGYEYWGMLCEIIESDPVRVFKTLFGEHWEFEWDRAKKLECSHGSYGENGEKNPRLFAFAMISCYVRERKYSGTWKKGQYIPDKERAVRLCCGFPQGRTEFDCFRCKKPLITAPLA
jgi:hypothetical protein